MSSPLAMLSMYDWPETRSALDAFWTVIADRLAAQGFEAPDRLQRDVDPFSVWTDPQLVIGQTCGWPYANLLHGKVFPFARFNYGLKDTPAGYYRSRYIVPKSAPSVPAMSLDVLQTSRRVAINGLDSQSGFHVFAEIGDKPADQLIDEGQRVISGAHRESLKMVSQNRADLAAIDGVAFELAARHDPDAVAHVRVIGSSNPRPGLPLITSPQYQNRTGMLFEVVRDALDRVEPSIRDQLMIQGVEPALPEDYREFAAA